METLEVEIENSLPGRVWWLVHFAHALFQFVVADMAGKTAGGRPIGPKNARG